MRLVGTCIILFSFYGLCEYWYQTYQRISQDLPAVYELKQLSIPLDGANSTHIIGAGELLQNQRSDSAERDHIRILRSALGEWQITNIAKRRKLALGYSLAGNFSSTQVPLSDGDKILVGGISYLVSISGSKSISLHTSRFGRLELSIDKICGLKFDLKRWTKGLASPPICRLVTVGGRSEILNGTPTSFGDDKTIHIKNSIVPENAISIAWDTKNFVLSLGTGKFIQICQNTGNCEILGRHAWPLSSPDLGDLKSLIVGRTLYGVEQTASELFFYPISRFHWLEKELFETYSAEFRLRPEALDARKITTLNGVRNPPSLHWALFDILTAEISNNGNFLLLLLIVSFAFWLVFKLTHRARLNPIDGFGAIIIIPATIFLAKALISANLIPARFTTWGEANILPEVLLFLLFPARYIIAIFGFMWGSVTLIIIAVLGFSILPNIDTYLFANSAAKLKIGVEDGEIFTAHISVIGLYFISMLAFLSTSWRKNRISLPLIIFWFCLCILVAAGSLNVMQLTFGHEYAAYLNLYQTHIAVIGAIAFFPMLAPMFDLSGFHRYFRIFLTGNTPRSKWFLFVLVLCSFLFVGIWGFIGTETGFGGVQPSEFAKSLLSLLFALTTTVALRSRATFAARLEPARVLTPLLAFAFVFLPLAGASILLSDLSPILIQIINVAFVSTLVLSFSIITRLGYLAVGLLILLIPYFAFSDLEILQKLAVLGIILSALILIIATMGRQSQLRSIDQIGSNTKSLVSTLTRFGIRYRAFFSQDGWFKWRQLKLLYQKLMPQSIELAAIVLIGLSFLTIWTANNFASDPGKLYRESSGKLRVPAERLLSWQDIKYDKKPAISIYSDLGLQAMKSRVLIARGGCALQSLVQVDENSITNKVKDKFTNFSFVETLTIIPQAIVNWLSSSPACALGAIELRTGRTSNQALSVPAVQDDFIAAFFVHIFGKDIALMVICAQIGLVISMLASALTAVASGWRNPHELEVGVASGLAIAGFAAILCTQFTLSWANIFGILPIVGQPMTFMSLGGSHHIFLALPSVILLVFVEHVFLDSQNKFKNNRARFKLSQLSVGTH